MVEIFKHKAEKANWLLEIDEKELNDFFENNEMPYYGGDIERLIFQSQLNASLRIFNNQEYHKDRYLTIEDLNNSIEFIKKKEDDDYTEWKNNYM